MTYKPEEFDWHDPRDVLIVHDADFNVIAYGTRKPKPVNVNRRSKPVLDA